MGSKAIQGPLWDRSPEDWANIQEKTGDAGYQYILNNLQLSGLELLDVGCGSGLFGDLAIQKGAQVTGLDASEKLLEQAKLRNSALKLHLGEMEELPFDSDMFDLVSGFNSFQYAADVRHAFAEARRVLKIGGLLVVMVWGSQADCEAASYLKAVGSLMPAPPPGAPGPFALSENRLLENIVEDAGFHMEESTDIPAHWDYPNVHLAIKGLMSAGPVARAINHSGLEQVYNAVETAIQPYIRDNGHVIYYNTFRIVVAKKLTPHP